MFSLSRIWKRDDMMHFEPIPYISGTKAQSILMQLVVHFYETEYDQAGFFMD